ncbi:MAG: hypothetical protein U9O94_02350 [Nanoarchaeota archaeon]|nr:hypothetical protein [Nanoarchaeota archaeon]
MGSINMKVKGVQTLVTIDLNRFKTTLVKQCEVQNRQAVRAWLKEAVKHIPGYTGLARGTLVPVGRLVDRVVARFGPGGPSGDQNRAAKKKKVHYGGRTFTADFQSGKSYAQAAITTKLSGLKITNSFTFTNELPYVARNDISGPPPGFIMPSNPPWQSHDKAAKVWKKYITAVAYKRLRVSSKFIKIRKLRVR